MRKWMDEIAVSVVIISINEKTGNFERKNKYFDDS